MSELPSAVTVASLSRGESITCLILCVVGIAIYTLLGVRRARSRSRAIFAILFSVSVLVTGSVLALVRWSEGGIRSQGLALSVFGLTIGVLWPLWVFFRVAAPRERKLSKMEVLSFCALSLFGCVFISIGYLGLSVAMGWTSTSLIRVDPEKKPAAGETPSRAALGEAGKSPAEQQSP
jgi:hypothetical protein